MNKLRDKHGLGMVDEAKQHGRLETRAAGSGSVTVRAQGHTEATQSGTLRPCLDAPQKLEFFRSFSITSIFGPMHEVVNVGKKITNYTV
jgi:hypothetical protein